MEENKRDYRSELDKFCLELDGIANDIFKHLGLLSHKHQIKVGAEYGRFKNQFNIGMALLMQACLEVNYTPKDLWPTFRSQQFIVFVHNLKTILSAFDRLLSGYYHDSSILIRAPYEGFIKTIYISLYKNINPYDVIFDVKKKNQPSFNVSNFLSQELKVDWGDYIIMSANSHANKYEIARESKVLMEKGQTQLIVPKIIYDEDHFAIGVNHLLFVLNAYLKFTREKFFVDEVDIKSRAKLLNNIDTFLELMFDSVIETHPKPYWPRVYKDLRMIMELIKISEGGGEWKLQLEQTRAKYI